ncbi:MAG: hypothetical protein ACLUDU_05600 [Butyricimonas faecihominis]
MLRPSPLFNGNRHTRPRTRAGGSFAKDADLKMETGGGGYRFCDSALCELRKKLYEGSGTKGTDLLNMADIENSVLA